LDASWTPLSAKGDHASRIPGFIGGR
jgi:hypothetical protein